MTRLYCWLRSLLWFGWLLVISATGRAAEIPRVVVSIPPVHSLVAGVSAGVMEPELLLDGSASPHYFQLRPSQMQSLAGADLVVWVGPGLESFLGRALAHLSTDAIEVRFDEIGGLTLLPARELQAWTRSDQESFKHHNYKTFEDSYDDMHVWLDPANAALIVTEVATQLSRIDPANTAQYQQNAQTLRRRLVSLDELLQAQLRPIRNTPYVVFHDAYQYFERRYGLSPIGAISVGDNRQPGARHLAALRTQLQALSVRCIFREPQFSSAQVDALVADAGLRVGVLDALGLDIAPGPEAYFTLLQRNATSLVACLAD